MKPFITLCVTVLNLTIFFQNYSQAQSDTIATGRNIISGWVTVNKSCLPGACVAAYLGNRLVSKTHADSSGRFVLTHLPEGTFRLKAVTLYNDVMLTPNLVLEKNEPDTIWCSNFFIAQKKLTQTKSTLPDTLLRTRVDSIVVMKAKRVMNVYGKGVLLKPYHICLGFSPTGTKHIEGDGKTPEGHYRIACKNLYSEYHKSICVSYPNSSDRDYARKLGKSPGGNIMIHGLPNGRDVKKEDYIHEDWTWGCIALTNEEIDDLFAHTTEQIPILILP